MKQKIVMLFMTMLYAVVLTTAKAEVVSVSLTREGTLAEKVLEQATSLSTVTELTISGPINESDWNCITVQMTNLDKLNMKESTTSFNTLTNLRASISSFIMPMGITKVNISGNSYNSQLQYLELSNSVEEIFKIFENDECDSFTTLKLANGLRFIHNRPFGWCDNLSTIYVDDVNVLLNIRYDSESSCLTYKERDYLADRQIYVKDEKLTNLTVLDVEEIHPYAFYGIVSLQEVTITDGVKNIGNAAFAECPSLWRIALPNTLESLGSGTFRNCAMLENITLPINLTSIPNNCFYGNSKLTSIELPSNLINIGSSAFGNCKSLEKISLPETLQAIGNSAFSGCSGLTKVTSLIPFPIAATNGIFSGIDIEKCTLVVPEWSAMLYKMAMGWSEFAKIETVATGDLASMTVTDSRYLPATVRPNGTPNVSILSTGSLTVRGESPFNMNAVTLGMNIGEGKLGYYYDTEGYYHEYYSPSLSGATLINDDSNISAQSAQIKLESIGGTWGFVSFPFDVKLSDITNDPEKEPSNFVFKYYDGERRGLVGTGGNWIEASNILKAGVGYIYQSQDSAAIYLKSTPETVANICNKSNIKTILQEYASEDAEDANWNFIGNPYPAYFDIHYIDFTAPITVWNGQGYDAVSLTDDDFVLSPYQAFFVQKQSDGNALTFFSEGRLAENRTIDSNRRIASRVSSASDNERQIYNIYLTNGQYTDKCRVVINDNSKIGYDSANDAVKFFSDNANLPQIYTLGEKDIEYSINERPLDSGLIELGVRSTNGSYNISSDSENQIFLLDRKDNRTIDLSIESYEFTSDKSDVKGRFAICLTNNMSSVDNISTSSTISISVHGETLSIECDKAETINVYSLDGINIATLNDNRSYSVRLTKGIYLVRTPYSVEKIIVR